MTRKQSGPKAQKQPPARTRKIDQGARPRPPNSAPPQPQGVAIALQQRLLDVFAGTFNDALTSDGLSEALQQVKQALFNRHFAQAFGSQENLEVYAARWSPTRALCYGAILLGLETHLEELRTSRHVAAEGSSDEESGEASPELRILSLGGGAAELAAAACLLKDDDDSDLRVAITMLDSAPWGQVIHSLQHGLTLPPPLSPYASVAAKAANTALVAPASRLHTTFIQKDILAASREEFCSMIGPPLSLGTPLLVTLLFTLNELFTAGGIGKTTALLLTLTTSLPLRSLLLVVDSPGSYSETAVGAQAKRYPMHWLLDRILLGTDEEPVVDGRRWEKLESQTSVWFRLDAALKYPIPLEDMRYQLHLYRVIEAAGEGP